MKITHNNKDYTLDIEKAVADGYLVPVQYTPVCSGATYMSPSGSKIVLIQDRDSKHVRFIGLGGTFDMYSDLWMPKEDFLKAYVNRSSNPWKYIGMATIKIP